MKKLNWSHLIGFVLITEGAGLIGSVFTTPEITGWYAALARPELAPPNWVFGPVWTTLFLLMGIAAYMVARAGFARADVRQALSVFVVQLGLNVLWSFIFFGMHNPKAAFFELVLLWGAIVLTIVRFGRVSKPAAWLLAPYLAWVTFAGYLNYMIWTLNI